MRLLLALAAFPLLTTFAPAALYRTPDPPARTRVSLEPIAFDASDPARRRVGRLIWLAGWRVRSNDARVGGISAMHVEGESVTALSDAGSVIRFGLRGGPASVLPLPDGPGALVRKSNRDSESLAVHGNKAWIAFELMNEVWRYDRASWSPLASAKPLPMRRWPENSGSEAMLRLPDGRFLIFSEGKPRPDGTSEVLLFDGDPAEEGTKVRALGYRAPKDYRITDAALLPDGRMLLLNRSFGLAQGFTAILTVAPALAPRRGEVIEGTEIGRLAGPLAVDNMEALSVTREGGRTIVWIASDDNFNPLQQTLLLKFALLD